MEHEKFIEIMESDESWKNRIDDGVIQGILLMRKYFPDTHIDGADHDVIFSSVEGYQLAAVITEEDAKLLARMGWHDSSEYDCMSHFV